jgi:hypothetical protein
MCIPQPFTPFMAWKHVFQHLEGLLINDYYEFMHTHGRLHNKMDQFQGKKQIVFIFKKENLNLIHKLLINGFI